MEVKIKEHYRNSFIAYGGGGKKVLGERSQDDLVKLAIMAHQSKSKTLLDVFETLPPLADLQKSKVDKAIKVKIG